MARLVLLSLSLLTGLGLLELAVRLVAPQYRGQVTGRGTWLHHEELGWVAGPASTL